MKVFLCVCVTRKRQRSVDPRQRCNHLTKASKKCDRRWKKTRINSSAALIKWKSQMREKCFPEKLRSRYQPDLTHRYTKNWYHSGVRRSRSKPGAVPLPSSQTIFCKYEHVAPGQSPNICWMCDWTQSRYRDDLIFLTLSGAHVCKRLSLTHLTDCNLLFAIMGMS